MGVEDNGGTGTRTETTDRPSTGDRTPAPPPDNPGSPGQPSRLESRARPREPQESRGEASGEGTAGRREGQPGSSQAAGETGKPEAPARTESGQGGRRDEQPRSQDNGAQTGTGTSAGRDRPPGQAAGRETDTRTEPADRSASQGRQYTLPADNPGSPGQPSRLDSRAPAREAQEQPRAQDAQDTGGGQTAGERGDQTGAAQGQTAGRSGESSGEQDGRDADKPELRQQTDTSPANGPATTERPPTRTETLRAAGWQLPEPPDHPSPQSDSRPPEHLPTGEQTPPGETSGEERPPQPEQADTADPQQDETTPKPDGPPAPPEGLNEPTPAEQNPQAADGPPGNGPQPHDERPGEKTEQPSGPQDGRPEGTTDETQTAERDAEPLGDSEQTPPIPDGRSSSDGQMPQPESPEPPAAEQGEPHTTDNTPVPREKADDEQKPPEPQGEQDTDQNPNENNTTNPEATDSGENTLPYLGPYNPNGQFTQTLEGAREGNFEPARSRDHQESTPEFPRWITEPLEIQQSSTQRDFDPTGAEREPGVAAKAPDRRTDRETELEPSIDKFRRATWARGEDLQNAGTLAHDATEGLLGPRPPAPSGHAEVGTGPTFSQPGTSGATPDSVVAALSAVMVAVEATRGAKRLTSRVIGLIRR